MFQAMKKLVPTRIKRKLLCLLSREELTLFQGKRVFLFLAADYGNIGDLAITAAQKKFLERHAGPCQVVPVPISQTTQLICFIRRNAAIGDLITIVGGGNMGVLYPEIEELRQLVINSFPENRIICFPQTLDWKDDAKSRRALNRIKGVYADHSDIHLFAREAVSRDKLQEIFARHPTVHVGYAPDIVLSATANSFGSTWDGEPHGIVLALRDDRERVLSEDQHRAVAEALAQSGHAVTVTDTHVGGWRLEQSVSDRMLAEKLREFSMARLVVTDRLHGMILAAIAGTPCLVLPSASHKLFQTWQEWLADIPQIRVLMLEDIGRLTEAVSELLSAARRDPLDLLVDPSVYNDLIKSVSEK